MPASRILLGVIGRPHGVRGLLRVHAYAADPASLEGYGPLVDDAGRRWRLRWRGQGVAELRDEADHPVADRTAAERLVNQRLWTTRDRLPAPEEDEYYLADLVGLDARDAAGAPLGRVAEVHDYGAGASLEITRPGHPPLLVPFTRACVPAVDLAGGTVTVALPDEVEVPEAADLDAPAAGAAA